MDMSARKILPFLLSLLLIGASAAYSQSAYFNTREGIFKLTGGPGSAERIEVDNGCGFDNNILSMALRNDTVYYNTWAGELRRFKLGVAGSCETLISGGPIYNSLTIDINGIIYMASESLVRYNPYTQQLNELGTMPFHSIGDMIFFNNKLLLAGVDPEDMSKTGIYEIYPDNLSASKLYMSTPDFLGLLSFPVSCGNNRYFGLTLTDFYRTQVTELDLANKQVTSNTFIIPVWILDGASNTESGSDNRINIANIVKTSPGADCSMTNGSVEINASSFNAPLTFTLLNTGKGQPTGLFNNLRGGQYDFRITDIKGCSTDTTVMLAENMPVAGCNDVFIPNAFTPNDDGRNDRFTLSIPTGFSDVSIQVFNRGGAKVFEGKGNNINWDGRYRGTKQPVDVYVYLLRFTTRDNSQKNLKGTVALLQ
jgi:gliding motility-associated-like protein